MALHFIEIGRDKKSWVADIKLNGGRTEREAAIAREASSALASRGVDAVFDVDSLAAGTIIVGGWRPVGRFEVR